MRPFKLDRMLDNAQRTDVSLMLQDGKKAAEVAAHLRRMGCGKINCRDVRQWAAKRVFNAAALIDRPAPREVKHNNYLDAIQRMHDFCDGRGIDFRLSMRKAIDEFIGRLS